MRSRSIRKQYRRVRSEDNVITGAPVPAKFGDEVHADHLISRRKVVDTEVHADDDADDDACEEPQPPPD